LAKVTSQNIPDELATLAAPANTDLDVENRNIALENEQQGEGMLLLIIYHSLAYSCFSANRADMVSLGINEGDASASTPPPGQFLQPANAFP
jgi:hypothetical protein